MKNSELLAMAKTGKIPFYVVYGIYSFSGYANEFSVKHKRYIDYSKKPLIDFGVFYQGKEINIPRGGKSFLLSLVK